MAASSTCNKMMIASLWKQRAAPFRGRFLSYPSLEPSYIIHPRVKMRNPESQALTLTKSREASQPPEEFVKFSANLDTTPWKRLLEKSIIFYKDFNSSSDHIDPDCPVSLVQNILKALFSQSSKYNSLKDLYVWGDCHVTSSWHCMGKRMDVRGRPGVLIKSRNPLKNFFDLNHQESSIDAEMPVDELFSKLNIWNVHKTIDTQPPAVQGFPHIHTLIITPGLRTSYQVLLQNSILYLHGLLTRQKLMKQSGQLEPEEMELTKPECGQSLITDGQEFSFVWYQLNTLDLNDVNSGMKNTVHMIKSQKLYTDIKHINQRQDYSSRRLANYNDEVLRNLISFFIWQ